MRAQDLIASAYRQLIAEIPALDKLKLVVRVELRGRGDVQVFRVQTPGPEVSKVDPEDARVEIAVPRADFNELAAEGDLERWREAIDTGHVKVGGDPDVVKLLATVIGKHMARTRMRKVR